MNRSLFADRSRESRALALPIVEYTCCSTRLTMQDQEIVAQRTLRIGVIVQVAILLAAIQYVVSSPGLYSALSEKAAAS